MAMPSMSPVIRRCLSGDQQAQEELVLAAQNRVYYHCRKMLKHEEDALEGAHVAGVHRPHVGRCVHQPGVSAVAGDRDLYAVLVLRAAVGQSEGEGDLCSCRDGSGVPVSCRDLLRLELRIQCREVGTHAPDRVLRLVG